MKPTNLDLVKPIYRWCVLVDSSYTGLVESSAFAFGEAKWAGLMVPATRSRFEEANVYKIGHSVSFVHVINPRAWTAYDAVAANPLGLQVARPGGFGNVVAARAVHGMPLLKARLNSSERAKSLTVENLVFINEEYGNARTLSRKDHLELVARNACVTEPPEAVEAFVKQVLAWD